MPVLLVRVQSFSQTSMFSDVPPIPHSRGLYFFFKTMQIQLYRNAFDKIGKEIDLIEALRMIKDCETQSLINKIRSTDKKDELKKQLPSFAFSGTFESRSKKGLKQHSGIVIVDLDHINDVKEYRMQFLNDRRVLFFFISPSGDGLKLAYQVKPIPKNDFEHKLAFEAIRAQTGLAVDKSGKDVSRLCFCSSDAELWWREDFNPTPIKWKQDMSAYGKRSLENAREELLQCAEGGRNAKLNVLAYNMGRIISAGHLLEYEALDVLLSSALEIGLSENEAKATIKSGFRAGIEKPRELKTYSGDGHSSQLPILSDDNFVKECYYSADEGDGKLFAHLNKGKVLFNHTSNRWLKYKNGKWQSDETCEVKNSISPMLVEQYAPYDDKGKRSLELKKVSKINNVSTSASWKMGTVTTEFDKDIYLFNVKNGTWDFKSWEFREHKASDMLMCQGNVDYVEDATCPEFIRFINIIFKGDANLIRFVQQFLGYSLTGSTSATIMLFCYGDGSTGKSTLFDIVKMVLGDYATMIKTELLLGKQRQSSDEYHLADLKGARFVFGDEIESGARLNEKMIKSIVGSDTIRASKKYQNPFEFVPTHKFAMFGNHKPTIRDTDFGIRRRLKLIPFEVSLDKLPEEDKMDKEVFLDIIRNVELSGVLNWLLEGLRDYKENGFVEPDAVSKATAEYFDEEDVFKNFLVQRTKLDVITNIKLSAVRTAYNAFAEENGYYPMSSKALAKELQGRGFTVRSGTGGQIWIEKFALAEAKENENVF